MNSPDDVKALTPPRLDALRTSHPIETPGLASAAQINQSFDKITYCKAASVLNMVRGHIGPEVFKKAIQVRRLNVHLCVLDQVCYRRAVIVHVGSDVLLASVRSARTTLLMCSNGYVLTAVSHLYHSVNISISLC